ncbi:hypothetical protein GW17_00020920 [Ensete ventricosum]|nr:hypothetical protein GW17_00020920 [Ensete ventricosum]
MAACRGPHTGSASNLPSFFLAIKQLIKQISSFSRWREFLRRYRRIEVLIVGSRFDGPATARSWLGFNSLLIGKVQRVGEGSASGLKWDLEVNSEKSWRGFSFVLALCCNCIRVSWF